MPCAQAHNNRLSDARAHHAARDVSALQEPHKKSETNKWGEGGPAAIARPSAPPAARCRAPLSSAQKIHPWIFCERNTRQSRAFLQKLPWAIFAAHPCAAVSHRWSGSAGGSVRPQGARADGAEQVRNGRVQRAIPRALQEPTKNQKQINGRSVR